MLKIPPLLILLSSLLQKTLMVRCASENRGNSRRGSADIMECCLSLPRQGGILLSAGARLMLAILEHPGGTYAIEDTDSMAICRHRARRIDRMSVRTGTIAEWESSNKIKALSWQQAQEIARKI